MAAARDEHGCAAKPCAEQQILLGELLTGSSLADKQQPLALCTRNDPGNESYIQGINKTIFQATTSLCKEDNSKSAWGGRLLSPNNNELETCLLCFCIKFSSQNFNAIFIKLHLGFQHKKTHLVTDMFQAKHFFFPFWGITMFTKWNGTRKLHALDVLYQHYTYMPTGLLP